MKVINLIGQPSAGKSTTAAGLFFEMKSRGIQCELVNEYAKDMVWRELPAKAFDDQIYITAKQNHKLWRLNGKVDYAITDSPLMLGLVYAAPDYYLHFRPLVLELFNSYDNEVFLIKRAKAYNPVGRNQNEEDAEKVHYSIIDTLDRYSIPYTEIDGDTDAPLKILSMIY